MVPYCAEQWSSPSLPSFADSAEAVQAFAVSQPLPSHPASHVHVHELVTPPTVPCSPQWILPSLPSLVESKGLAVHALAIWQLVLSYPGLQSVHVQDPVVPPIVPPLTQ